LVRNQESDLVIAETRGFSARVEAANEAARIDGLVIEHQLAFEKARARLLPVAAAFVASILARNFSAREDDTLDLVMPVSLDELDPVGRVRVKEITFEDLSQDLDGQDFALKLSSDPGCQLQIRRRTYVGGGWRAGRVEGQLLRRLRQLLAGSSWLAADLDLVPESVDPLEGLLLRLADHQDSIDHGTYKKEQSDGVNNWNRGFTQKNTCSAPIGDFWQKI